MIIGLNHLALASDEPDRTAAAYAILFDRKAEVFVAEDGATLHRFRLSNMAFEIRAAKNGVVGLCGLGFATDDLDATRHKLSRRGLAAGEPMQENWINQAGGSGLRRRTSDLAVQACHGVPVTLVQTAEQSPATANATGVIGLDHVVIRSPNPERAIALYGGRLGLDFALDRSNPDWGSRLLFFRTGGVTVEIGHSLGKGVSDQPDQLWGVAWRVPDAAVSGAQLKAAGFDTSEANKGRRPGSTVLSVRSGTGGVPTILLSAVPKDAQAG